MDDNPFQSPDADRPQRPRRASRVLMAVSFLLACLFAFFNYRMSQVLSYATGEETINRFIVWNILLAVGCLTTGLLSRAR